MNKVVVVTGASSGIGKELSKKFALEGKFVVLISRSKNKLIAIEEEIKRRNGKCVIIPTDLAVPEEIEEIKKKVNRFGLVSILINNAGVGYFSSIDESTVGEWEKQMNINVRSAFLLSKAFVPDMKKNNEGSLLFVNSIAGLQSFSNSAAYTASKYALRGLANSLREELRSDNIKVMSVFPGAVNTPFWDGINNQFNKKDMLNVESLADSIIHAINAPGNLTIEEMVMRRTLGDF